MCHGHVSNVDNAPATITHYPKIMYSWVDRGRRWATLGKQLIQGHPIERIGQRLHCCLHDRMHIKDLEKLEKLLCFQTDAKFLSPVPLFIGLSLCSSK